MAEHLRISSPLSSSPGRAPVFARPDWSWSRYGSRPSSVHSTSTSVSAPRAHGNSWDPSRSSNSLNPSSTPQTGNSPGTPWLGGSGMRQSITTGATSQLLQDSHRQWTFTGFEWVVRDVHQLKNFVETSSSDSPEEKQADHNFEILKESPLLGDGKFKLEIAPTPSLDSSVTPPRARTLSLYITSLMIDFAHADYEMSASMMAAIKCQDDRFGERGARPEWVWQIWQNDWVFRQESEVWECPLPTFSVLLEHPRIRETDSFVICIQIHCPIGPLFPEQPSAYYVPRELLEGLEASLDNANTGDVKFICLEKMSTEVSASPDPSPEDTSVSSISPSSSQIHFTPETKARKRIIYAHSDILIRRSEYFATMLGSSFSEAQTLPPGDRKFYTIVVEEADFVTIYWLLKYVYANWLLFKEHDDPRVAVDGVGAGWNTRWLSLRGGEWDWKIYRKAGDGEESIAGDARSVTSGGSLHSNEEGNTLPNTSTLQPRMSSATPMSRTSPGPRTNASTSGSGSKANTATPSPARQSTTATARRTTSTTVSNTSLPLGITTASGVTRSKAVPIQMSPGNQGFAPAPHYPISPRSQRQHPHIVSAPDPHPHPTSTPPPASALSIYQVAHRYAMPGLALLALEHMMSTITPQSSFALLLATSIWDELHSLIEDYVVEKWEEVSTSAEFEQCCQEVAAGEWGAEGGKTLMTLFRRLRSPSAISYTRS